MGRVYCFSRSDVLAGDNILRRYQQPEGDFYDFDTRRNWARLATEVRREVLARFLIERHQSSPGRSLTISTVPYSEIVAAVVGSLKTALAYMGELAGDDLLVLHSTPHEPPGDAEQVRLSLCGLDVPAWIVDTDAHLQQLILVERRRRMASAVASIQNI